MAASTTAAAAAADAAALTTAQFVILSECVHARAVRWWWHCCCRCSGGRKGASSLQRLHLLHTPLRITGSCLLPCRNQRNHAALEATRIAHAQLQAEHQLVVQQLEESTQESYSVSEHFRQEVLAAKQHIAELQQQHEQVRLPSKVAHSLGLSQAPPSTTAGWRPY